MGFLDTKKKAVEYDTANAQNAQVAQQVTAMKAAELAAENQYLKGLAATAIPQTNPNMYANVPGQEMGQYALPQNTVGMTGQDPRFNQMMMRESLAQQSNGGLANTLNQDMYKGAR